MMEFFIGVLAGVILFYIGLRIAARMLLNHLARRLEEIHEVTKDEPIDARLEEHNGVFYVYSVENNEFLGQGNSIAELKEHFRARMTQYRINIAEGDEDVIARLKATTE